MNDPEHLPDRLHAAILGKIVGVYMGRPVEHWTRQRIAERFGTIDRHVAAELGFPVVVTDDDIAAPFVFVRAIEAAPPGCDPTAAHVAETWLGELVEGRSTLWWGGFGVATEHTAYRRLASGSPAPQSGSARLNGRTLSEQIGGMIFIDGWSLVCAGDPERAAKLARTAASVSHDGLALDAAAAIAAMQSAAFTASSMEDLIDVATEAMPADSALQEVAQTVKQLRAEGLDWRGAMDVAERTWTHSDWRGSCHVVPNFAIVLVGLLFGAGDPLTTLSIIVSAGQDTDSNAGVAGTIVGAFAGSRLLADRPDLLEPVGGFAYVPSASGSDAIMGTGELVASLLRYRAHLYGATPPAPARAERSLTFLYERSLQGFRTHVVRGAPEPELTVRPEDAALLLHQRGPGETSVVRNTFPDAAAFSLPIYDMVATPVLHSGDTLGATLQTKTPGGGARAALVVTLRDVTGAQQTLRSADQTLSEEPHRLSWRIPPLPDGHIEACGFVVSAEADAIVSCSEFGWRHAPSGSVPIVSGDPYADYRFVTQADRFVGATRRARALLANASGIGIALYGPREWPAVSVSASMSADLADRFGVVFAAKTLRDFMTATVSRDGRFAVTHHKAGQERILAQTDPALPAPETADFVVSPAKDSLTATCRAADADPMSLGVDIPHGALGGSLGFCVSSGATELSRLDFAAAEG